MVDPAFSIELYYGMFNLERMLGRLDPPFHSIVNRVFMKQNFILQIRLIRQNNNFHKWKNANGVKINDNIICGKMCKLQKLLPSVVENENTNTYPRLSP